MTERHHPTRRFHRAPAALDELDGAMAEVQDEEFPVPSDVALTNARRLLKEMNGNLSHRTEVYPALDGGTAIDTPNERGRSVLPVCASGGGALCLVNLNGRHRWTGYPDAGRRPDDFVREAPADLARHGLSTA